MAGPKNQGSGKDLADISTLKLGQPRGPVILCGFLSYGLDSITPWKRNCEPGNSELEHRWQIGGKVRPPEKE